MEMIKKANLRIYGKKADFDSIANKYNIDKVVARIIRNRDVITDEEINKYINGNICDLYDPHLMKDVDKAIGIINEKISLKKRIRIIGDYDIDGVSSIFILLKALRNIGANVDYVVPHRVLDGYGINENLVDNAYKDSVDTIITCDNGIAAISQIKHAKELGMTVIVTDHHDVGYEEIDGNKCFVIPPADAVINPKQEDCEYPFKGLCGAVVAYKFVEALYKSNGYDMSIFEELFEFAAIATVGDVMVLKDENRIIVKEGLKRIRKSKNAGLRALIKANGIDMGNISSYHIGFVIGPCLNASGRLDSAQNSIELLLAEDEDSATKLAGQLKKFNDERKQLTDEQVKAAVDIVENSSIGDDDVLVVYLPECHESIAGIIAGRLRERYYKPTFVITNSENGLKGSGRSIAGYHMFDKLNEVSKYLTKFGGHPMAAGLSLEENQLEQFRKELNENAKLTKEQLTPIKWIDVKLPLEYITEMFIENLSVLEPCGNGNEKPVFAENELLVSDVRRFGANKDVLKLKLTTRAGFTYDGVKFKSNPDIDNVNVNDMVSVVFYPSINEYNGNRSIQIIIDEIRKM